MRKFESKKVKFEFNGPRGKSRETAEVICTARGCDILVECFDGEIVYHLTSVAGQNGGSAVLFSKSAVDSGKIAHEYAAYSPKRNVITNPESVRKGWQGLISKFLAFIDEDGLAEAIKPVVLEYLQW